MSDNECPQITCMATPTSDGEKYSALNTLNELDKWYENERHSPKVGPEGHQLWLEVRGMRRDLARLQMDARLKEEELCKELSEKEFVLLAVLTLVKLRSEQ